ncbi:MAG TPA: cupin domain-containing protein [Acidobacteriaceae bacterium]|jgi:quercetin dioxygenase-like cupin family protein|nr:cupin domain-containing protein [Acidobacteriaceae bacterium]
MHRRRFVQSAAALFPLTLIDRALAAAPAPLAAPETHLIPNGQDRLSEHHSLGFSTISFKVLPRETAGTLFLIEHTGLRKGGGPPLHVHYSQEEYFYVMDGDFLFQVGDRRVALHSGDSVLGPRNLPHTFTVTSETPGHMLIAFTPAGQMEDFFRTAEKPGATLNDPALFASHGMKLLGPPLAAS